MICDLRLVDMNEEELVAIVEQPDGSMLDTTVQVARNGGASPLRSNAEGSKSTSAADDLLPITQENSRSSDGLLPRMCC